MNTGGNMLAVKKWQFILVMAVLALYAGQTFLPITMQAALHSTVVDGAVLVCSLLVIVQVLLRRRMPE